MRITLLLFFQLLLLQFSFAKQPNIILIYVDDLGYGDLGCQGSKDIFTPHIDALAASGVRFTSGYCTAPQCGPSRAGIMSGMNQGRFGYWDNSSNQGLPGGENLLIMPGWLKRYGYATAMIGKWHIGWEPDFPEDVVERSYPWNNGFDYTLMIQGGHSHYFPYRTDGKKWMVDRNREYRLAEYDTDDTTPHMLEYPEDAYLTDVFTDECLNFIKRQPKDKPFFVYLAYNAPHTPCTAKAEDKAANSHIADNARRNFAGVMTGLDNAVGHLMDSLEQLQLTEETLVFFISDNGGSTSTNTSVNTPFSGFKGDLREGGIRVPYIASWPGTIDAGQVLDEPVTTLDILPTLVNLAGGELYAPMRHEGLDIMPYMKNGAKPDREFILVRWRKSGEAIRSGEWKLTEPFKPNLDYSGLYRIVKDTLEENATKVDNPEVRTRLENILKDWNNVMQDSYQPIIVPPLELNEKLSGNLKVFPNPASKLLTIESPQIINSIVIYTTSGKAIYRKATSNCHYRLNVSQYFPGAYILEVNTQNTKHCQKIIIT